MSRVDGLPLHEASREKPLLRREDDIARGRGVRMRKYESGGRRTLENGGRHSPHATADGTCRVPFSARVREISEVPVLEVSGEVCLVTARKFREALEEAVAAGRSGRPVVVDLSVQVHGRAGSEADPSLRRGPRRGGFEGRGSGRQRGEAAV